MFTRHVLSGHVFARSVAAVFSAHVIAVVARSFRAALAVQTAQSVRASFFTLGTARPSFLAVTCWTRVLVFARSVVVLVSKNGQFIH
jgi:hypothetical protein